MLGLPESIYEKYDKVVKGCKVCGTSVPSPPRATISGMRASEFGDVIFVDHQQIQFRTAKYVVLLVLAGATNLLWVTAQKSLLLEETISLFVCGLRRIAVFRKESLLRISRQTSRSFTSAVTSLSIHAAQEHLGRIEPKPPYVCLRKPGCCLLSLLAKKDCLRKLHFVKQWNVSFSSEIASLRCPAILRQR